VIHVGVQAAGVETCHSNLLVISTPIRLKPVNGSGQQVTDAQLGSGQSVVDAGRSEVGLL
jgi:hypothetical protein